MMKILLRTLIEIIIGIAAALFLRKHVCLLAYVKGRSMEDTLRNGEVVFAIRKAIAGELKRFDVVLCRYPERKELFIKRIVALPNETVSIDEDVLYIDGQAVAEGFAKRRSLRPMAERKVGENEFFVLGDNRPASRDSRTVGAIPAEKIEAVVKCVLFPLNRVRKI